MFLISSVTAVHHAVAQVANRDAGLIEFAQVLIVLALFFSAALTLALEASILTLASNNNTSVSHLWWSSRSSIKVNKKIQEDSKYIVP